MTTFETRLSSLVARKESAAEAASARTSSDTRATTAATAVLTAPLPPAAAPLTAARVLRYIAYVLFPPLLIIAGLMKLASYLFPEETDFVAEVVDDDAEESPAEPAAPAPVTFESAETEVAESATPVPTPDRDTPAPTAAAEEPVPDTTIPFETAISTLLSWGTSEEGLPIVMRLYDEVLRKASYEGDSTSIAQMEAWGLDGHKEALLDLPAMRNAFANRFIEEPPETLPTTAAPSSKRSTFRFDEENLAKIQAEVPPIRVEIRAQIVQVARERLKRKKIVLQIQQRILEQVEAADYEDLRTRAPRSISVEDIGILCDAFWEGDLSAHASLQALQDIPKYRKFVKSKLRYWENEFGKPPVLA